MNGRFGQNRVDRNKIATCHYNKENCESFKHKKILHQINKTVIGIGHPVVIREEKIETSPIAFY